MSISNDITRRDDASVLSSIRDLPAPTGGLQFLEQIGHGGFGAVYRATDDRLGRVVAAKVLLDDSTGRDRFLAEAMITGNLQHPHIIPVHSLATDSQGRAYFTMPVVHGRSLDAVLLDVKATGSSSSGEFTIPRLVAILVAVCEAVAYAHSRGVVHRDVKPQNIMIGRFGEVFVLDWGIAKLMGQAVTTAMPKSTTTPKHRESSPLDAELAPTLSGTIVGTPGYMSPEQARGDIADVGFSSDIYSLGVVLFQMLTLSMPVNVSSLETALRETIEGSTRHACDGKRERLVPRALADIAAKAMALEPKNRYPDVLAMVQDLRAWLEDREVSASPDSTRQRAARWLRHHRIASTAIVGGLISSTLAALIIMTLISVHSAERQRLAEVARGEAERASALERNERLRMEKRASAFREYLPGLDLLERAEWNSVWAERATDAFDRALAIDPDFAEAHRARGKALALSGRFPESLAAYERALEYSRASLGKDDPELLRTIGDILWTQMKDISGATTWYNRAVTSDPTNAHARVADAMLSEFSGDHAKAIATLRQLSHDAPDWWEVHQSLGLLLLGAPISGRMIINDSQSSLAQDPTGSELELTEAIRLRPGYAALYVQRCNARYLQMKGNPNQREIIDGCLTDLDCAVALQPGYLNAHTLRLQFNYMDHRQKVVDQELAILRRLWPKDPVALHNRMGIEVKEGRGEAFLDEVNSALQENPTSAALRQVHDELVAKLTATPVK